MAFSYVIVPIVGNVFVVMLKSDISGFPSFSALRKAKSQEEREQDAVKRIGELEKKLEVVLY